MNPLYRILGEDFPELFKGIAAPINPPDPIDADEAVEGIVAMPEETP